MKDKLAELQNAIITLQSQVKCLQDDVRELRFRANHAPRFERDDKILFRGWDKKIHEGTIYDVDLKFDQKDWSYRVKDDAGGKLHDGLNEAVLFTYDELNPGKRP